MCTCLFHENFKFLRKLNNKSDIRKFYNCAQTKIFSSFLFFGFFPSFITEEYNCKNFLRWEKVLENYFNSYNSL